MNQPTPFDDVPLRPVGPGLAAPRTSGMAITSLVLGCVSFMCWIFTGLPAVILGIVALRQINRSKGQLKGDGLAIGGIVTGGVSCFLILPVMVALLLPAVQAAREAARRSMAMNNLKVISLGLLNYETSNKTLPAAKGGPESQLSWRVHILPYMEEGGAELYEQFHLDEPWDSEHNRQLIAKMPDAYKDPAGRLPQGETNYLAVTGPGTAFGDGTSGPSLRDFTDGLSRTITLVEADQGVPWTKPDDWQFDPNGPINGVGNMRLGGFLAAMGDGSVQFIRAETPAEALKALMTRDGDEQIDLQ
jgi:hypothetical protein